MFAKTLRPPQKKWLSPPFSRHVRAYTQPQAKHTSPERGDGRLDLALCNAKVRRQVCQPFPLLGPFHAVKRRPRNSSICDIHASGSRDTSRKTVSSGPNRRSFSRYDIHPTSHFHPAFEAWI